MELETNKGNIRNKDSFLGVFVILFILTITFALGMRWAFMPEPKDHALESIESKITP